ncbi:hypothetical protein BH09ACT4_BH09ACT4_12990 [soil metagenome]
MPTQVDHKVTAPRTARPFRRVLLGVSVTLALGVGAWVIGWGASVAFADDMPKWAFARATGVTSYLMLTAVTVLGLLLSHPRRAQWRWPDLVVRLRLHIAAAALAILFTVGHVVILATDDFADVGWLGAIVPFAAQYRPVATGLGVLAFWSVLLSTVTASLAGRRGVRRVWWPLHKIAAVAFCLSWVHAVVGGTDVIVLLGVYVSTGLLIVWLAIWRYASRNPTDERRAFARTARVRNSDRNRIVSAEDGYRS